MYVKVLVGKLDINRVVGKHYYLRLPTTRFIHSSSYIFVYAVIFFVYANMCVDTLCRYSYVVNLQTAIINIDNKKAVRFSPIDCQL